MVTSKKIILGKHFDGMPQESDFKIVEEQLPPLKDGGEYPQPPLPHCLPEFLAEAVFLSVDPYMRAYAHNMNPGDVMVGTQVAKYPNHTLLSPKVTPSSL